MTEEQNSSNPLSLAIKGKRPPRSARIHRRRVLAEARRAAQRAAVTPRD